MNIKKALKATYSLNSIFYISVITTLLYFITKTYIFANYNSPIGDEVSFLRVFDAIMQDGFYATWASGNFSPVFYLIVYPLNLLIDNPLVSFRILSILSTTLSLFLIYKFAKDYLKLSNLFIKSVLIFSISFLAYRIYWQGINDSLFHLLIILSFFPIYNIHYKRNITKNCIVLGIILGLLIGTRFMAFLVLPGYIFFFYNKLKQGFLVAFIALFLGISFHSPSLFQNGSLASVDKNPGNGLTWAQLNYLSQQYIYDGKIKDGNRVTFEEVKSYIDKNGSDILPRTFLESVSFNPKWTIKELFKDFWHSIVGIYLPILGLGVILLLLFPFKLFRKKYDLSPLLKLNSQFINFFWLHTFFISLIVLVRIEVRWYTAFIYLAIIFYHQLVQDYQPFFNKKRQLLFLKFNLITLICFQLWFVLLTLIRSSTIKSWIIENLKTIS